jgi:hypothetical protein
MNKIIFLDFDGVLNTQYYQEQLQSHSKKWQDEYGALFDPNAVKQLKRIIDATNADIVVESSWKYHGLDAMKELWEVRNLPGRIIDITPSTISDEYLLPSDLENIHPSMLHCKGIEISSWLSKYETQDIRYVIIDDEFVILNSQLSHFILTNPYEGITEEQANQAISILNG